MTRNITRKTHAQRTIAPLAPRALEENPGFRRRLVPALFGAVALALLSAVPSHTAEYQPIGLSVEPMLLAGQTTSCHVTLTGAGAPLTIYSLPAGAVSYQGVVHSTDVVVQAQVSANLPPNTTVQIFAKTDGLNVVRAYTMTAQY